MNIRRRRGSRVRRPWVEAVAVAALTTVVAAILAATAVFVAREDAASATARHARVVVDAEAVINAITVEQSTLAQATVFAQSDPAGDAVALLLGEATSTNRAIAERMTSLAGTLESDDVRSAPLEAVVDRYSAAAADMIDFIGEGAVTPEAASSLESAFGGAAEALTTLRDSRAGQLEAATGRSGTAATAARTFVVVFLPILVIFATHRALKGRQARRDLETRLEAEQELRRDKDRLVAAVTNDLSQPSRTIARLAESLRSERRRLSAGDRNQLIETLADETGQLLNRVGDLAVMSRLDTGTLDFASDDVDVRDVIRQLTYGWSTGARSRLAVSGNGAVLGDAIHVKHILRNLLAAGTRAKAETIDVSIRRSSVRLTISVSYEGVTGMVDHMGDVAIDDLGSEGDMTHRFGIVAAQRLATEMSGAIDFSNENGVPAYHLRLPIAHRTEVQPQSDVVIDPLSDRPTSADIAFVIEGGPPTIVYEPIVALSPQRVVIGYEALSRFPFGEPPDWFEEATLLGRGVDMELAAIKAAAAGFDPAQPGAFLSVNVSADTLASFGLQEAIGDLSASTLVLELAEDAAIANYESIRGAVDVLAGSGFRLALDDVGQGETDLWHTLRMRPTIVKVDRSVIRDLDKLPGMDAMIAGIVAFAHQMGAQVVAEGVETEEVIERLVALGVDAAQGYIFGEPDAFQPRPMPAALPWESRRSGHASNGARRDATTWKARPSTEQRLPS